MGTVNLITPAKRRYAASLVREGTTVSLAHNQGTEKFPDNPPLIHVMYDVAGSDQPGFTSSRDTYTMTYHGTFYSHMDALCHFVTTYLEEGVRLLELAQRAHRLFQKQEPREKRRLLNFLPSNCSWKGGEVTAVFRQPFDMLADANVARREWDGQNASTRPGFENWLPGLDSN